MELVEIGKIVKHHGLDGAMRISIPDEYLEDFVSAEVVFIQQSGQPVPFFIEEVDVERMFVWLDEVNNKEAASALANKRISLRKSDLIPEEEKMPLPESHLKYAPYIGFVILDEDLGEIGVIKEIVEYPQQELGLVMKKGKELLIPLNAQYIEDIQIEEKRIIVNLPEGMLDVQL